jgi:hypothetical protein
MIMPRRLAPSGYWLLVLLATVVLAYWPGLNGGFVFDDYPNIVFNEPLHVTTLKWDDWLAAIFSSMSSDLQRPLAMLTFALNHYFTGLNPWPMKLVNVGIHLVNTLLVFGLTRAILRSVPTAPVDQLRRAWMALAVAALWALAPINLMAVLFIVQRMESLCHSFVIAGLWLYVIGRQRQLAGRQGWRHILVGLGAGTVFGLLSKESAVLLPLYAFLTEIFLFYFRDAAGRRDFRLSMLYLLGLAVPALLGGGWLLQRSLQAGSFGSREFNLVERLLTEPRVVLDYLHWTLLPDLQQMSLFHDDYVISRNLWQPASTLPAILVIAALVVVTWLIRKRRPLIALGISWFLAAQLLTATIIPLELVFEHRNYFASLGVFLALADLLLFTRWPVSLRRPSILIVCLLIVLSAVDTRLRAEEWSNPLRFAIAEVAKHPLSPRATYQLGQTYVILSEGKPNSPFVTAAFTALESARHVPDANVLPAQGLLMLASRTGRPLKDVWWQDMEYRLRNHPIGPQEHGALAAMTECAVAEHCHFPPEHLDRMFDAALSRGNDPEVMNIYANYVLHILGRPELALGLWKITIELNPGEPVYRISTIKLLIAMGRRDEARVEIAKLRKLGRLGQFERLANELELRARESTP